MYYLVLIVFLLFSCPPKPDFEKESQAIRQLQVEQRQNHFEKNTKEFIAQHSDDLISIDRGAVRQPSRDSMFQMFDAYFKSVSFIIWDDKKPPVIRFSDDASVAYVAVEKLVVLDSKSAAGATVRDTAHYAWMSVYKKIDGVWKLDAIASTNQ